MARASKTTTSTTINKYHFLFFILVTNSNPEQDRQFVPRFSVFWYSIYRISIFPALSWAGRRSISSSVCLWPGRAVGLGCGPSVILWPCVPVSQWPRGYSVPARTWESGIQWIRVNTAQFCVGSVGSEAGARIKIFNILFFIIFY